MEAACLASAAAEQPAATVASFLRALLPSVDGLRAVVIADSDGCPIIHCDDHNTSNDGVPRPENDNDVYRTLTAFYTVAAEQARKIKALGGMTQLLSLFEGGLLLQVDCHPVIITFHASLSTNAGELIELVPAVKEAIEPIRQAVAAYLEKEAAASTVCGIVPFRAEK